MKARFLVPLGIFLGLLALFVAGMQRDPRHVPSPLVGKPAPAFSLPSLGDQGEVGRDRLTGHPVSLLNVWASWCTACREEHPFLMELSRRGEVPIYGLNYKDERTEARAWLARFGDPYLASAFDHDGRVGIDWGVYGVPETFVIDGRGNIRYKHIGPLTPQVWDEELEPLIEQLEAQQQ